MSGRCLFGGSVGDLVQKVGTGTLIGLRVADLHVRSIPIDLLLCTHSARAIQLYRVQNSPMSSFKRLEKEHESCVFCSSRSWVPC